MLRIIVIAVILFVVFNAVHQDALLKREHQSAASVIAPVQDVSQCAIHDFELKSGKVWLADECRSSPCLQVKIRGEVVNHCVRPAGVQLQITSRDNSGSVIDTVSLWPASTDNIQSGASYPFNLDGMLDADQAATRYTIEIVKVNTWR